MIISFTTIICLALICITCLEIFCPAGTATQTIVIIISFLTPTIGQILGLYKTQENAGGIKEIKVATDGQTTQAIAQASHLATLTEKVESAKTAAEVAARTASNTALALKTKEG